LDTALRTENPGNAAQQGILGRMTDATAALEQTRVRRLGVSDLVFLGQVSRPGLWTTTALFYWMPLGHVDPTHSAVLWLGLFYVLIPMGFLIYGVNDIVDAEADRLNPRKGSFLFGSRGGAEQLASLKWQIVLLQIPFLLVFFYLLGPRILWWCAALLLAVGLYNAPRLHCKSRPPFDVLIQASYLLVFVIASWLNKTSQLPWPTFLFGAMFAMHSHIFGEVLDLEPDVLTGRRTTATLLGRVPSKMLIACLLSVESALIYFYFHDLVIAAFLGIGAVWFLADATLFWKNRAYTPTQMRLFMFGWNAAAVLGLLWNWSQATLTHTARALGF
jgi:4-hydroxybenzoate polyprenyltransferase